METTKFAEMKDEELAKILRDTYCSIQQGICFGGSDLRNHAGAQNELLIRGYKITHGRGYVLHVRKEI